MTPAPAPVPFAKGDLVRVEYTGYVLDNECEGNALYVGNASPEDPSGDSGGYVWSKHCTLIKRAYVPRVGDVVRNNAGLLYEVMAVGPGEVIDISRSAVDCNTVRYHEVTFYARPELLS